MTAEREFEWSLRLRDGRYLQRCIGTSIEDAAKRAKVSIEQVRRALPTAIVLTAEEIAARKARFQTLRKHKEQGGNDGED